jgi:hypothetical protein
LQSIDPTTQPFPTLGQRAQNLYQDDDKAFVQELRLQGKLERLNWLVGAYYSHNSQTSYQYTEDNIWASATTFFGLPIPAGGDPFGPGYSSYDNAWGTPLINGSGTYLARAHRPFLSPGAGHHRPG